MNLELGACNIMCWIELSICVSAISMVQIPPCKSVSKNNFLADVFVFEELFILDCWHQRNIKII